MSQNITVDEKPPQVNRRVWTQRGIVDSKCERERNDLYKTPSFAVDELLKYETFHHRVWEPSCGTGNISEPLIRHGYEVRSTDLIDRGYGTGGIDFLGCKEPWDGDIVTNPPYSLSNEFVVHALSLVGDGRKVCMLLRLQHLEGKKRYNNIFAKNPPQTVYVSVRRLPVKMDGYTSKNESTVCYAWFVWQKGWQGEPVIRWFNTDKVSSRTENLQ